MGLFKDLNELLASIPDESRKAQIRREYQAQLQRESKPGSIPTKPLKQSSFERPMVSAAITEMSIELPIATFSEANCRDWVRIMKQKAQQKKAVFAFMRGLSIPPLPAVITFTRYGARRLDDDNLSGAFKHIRDAVAEAYGVDDNDVRYRFEYEQEIRNAVGVKIHIQHKEIMK